MQPGSIVICVNDRNFDSDAKDLVSALPQKDHLYTVRELIPDTNDPMGEPGIALEEIYGKLVRVTTYTGRSCLVEFHFYAWRFAEVRPPQKEEITEEVLMENTN